MTNDRKAFLNQHFYDIPFEAQREKLLKIAWAHASNPDGQLLLPDDQQRVKTPSESIIAIDRHTEFKLSVSSSRDALFSNRRPSIVSKGNAVTDNPENTSNLPLTKKI